MKRTDKPLRTFGVTCCAVLLSLSWLRGADIEFGWDDAVNTNVSHYDFILFRSNSWHFAGLAALTPQKTGVITGLTNGSYIIGVQAVSSNALASEASNAITALVARVIINLEYATNLGVSNGWQVAQRFTNQIVTANSLFYRARLQFQ